MLTVKSHPFGTQEYSASVAQKYHAPRFIMGNYHAIVGLDTKLIWANMTAQDEYPFFIFEKKPDVLVPIATEEELKRKMKDNRYGKPIAFYALKMFRL